jgi:hypothetical protein
MRTEDRERERERERETGVCPMILTAEDLRHKQRLCGAFDDVTHAFGLYREMMRMCGERKKERKKEKGGRRRQCEKRGKSYTAAEV